LKRGYCFRCGCHRHCGNGGRDRHESIAGGLSQEIFYHVNEWSAERRLLQYAVGANTLGFALVEGVERPNQQNHGKVGITRVVLDVVADFVALRTGMKISARTRSRPVS